MAIDSTTPRSRRAMLAAGLGALGATVATAIGRPTVTRAANGDNLVVGQGNTATLATSLQNSANGTGLIVVSGTDAVSPAAKIGVYGYANQDANARAIYGKSLVGTGVWGNSDTGRGLFGRSTAGTGVSAQSDTGRAVYGTTAAPDKSALLGHNTSGGSAGVQGYSGAGLAPAPEPETGVEGVSNASSAANGVHGLSQVGAGVWGATDSGVGVVGTSGTGGVGVYGAGDLGVYAEGAVALQVQGPAFFSDSGRATISTGSALTVAPEGGIGPDTIVLAVLHTNRGGIWVRAVVPSEANQNFVVYLNTNVPGATAVAWFVIN